MKTRRSPESNLPTYVFVDVSNIRSSCLKTLGVKIDFYRLLIYFKRKYQNLQEVRYYEGIANDDAEKREEFKKLEEAGYTVCPMERKAYIEKPVYKIISCKNCGKKRRIQVLKQNIKLKSNVDVYLATDLLKIAYRTRKQVKIILVSCDGDYAEMIKSAIEVNPRVQIDVLATPVVPLVATDSGKLININTCSTRLQKLRGKINNFRMLNIKTIQDLIKEK